MHGEEFKTEPEYLQHLKSKHDDSKPEVYSPELIAAVVGPSLSPHRDCPFCPTSFSDTVQMHKHTAFHLERFALFALPTIDDNDNGDEGMDDSDRSSNSHQVIQHRGRRNSLREDFYPEDDHIFRSVFSHAPAVEDRFSPMLNEENVQIVSYLDGPSRPALTQDRYDLRDWASTAHGDPNARSDTPPEYLEESSEHPNTEATAIEQSTSLDDITVADQRTPLHDDFNIAIICGSHLEITAMKKIFDHTWKAYKIRQRHTDDYDTYTYGRIGRHFVVLIWSPGTNKISYRDASSRLQSSFKSIEFVLAIGICSAVPKVGEQEVLLGDVIISTSVQNVDEGKRYELGRNMRKFLGLLQTETSLSQLRHYCAGYFEKYFGGDNSMQYPGAYNDELYNPGYLHRHYQEGRCRCSAKKMCYDAYTSTCEELKCGEVHIIPRERIKKMMKTTEGNSMIHFGAVGSGNIAMMSANQRGEFAMKESVMAFERGAAAAFDHYHDVVVIQGIFHYEDGHWSRIWLSYATAIAVACIRAFLQMKEDWKTD